MVWLGGRTVANNQNPRRAIAVDVAGVGGVGVSPDFTRGVNGAFAKG